MSEPAPILRVTVGTPIYTQDAAKLGKVKEVRGQAFKVETGMFQRDYWLPAETVKEAAPDVAITLAVNKNEIGDLKIDEPRAA